MHHHWLPIAGRLLLLRSGLLPAGGTTPRIPCVLSRLAVLLALSTALSGCVVVGPDFEKPAVSLPTKWGAASATRASKPPELSHWWQRLGDPMLDELVDDAVAGNLDVAKAKARIREARASYRQSVGTLFPQADAGGAATRGKSGGDVSGQFRAGLDASWELDLFGANRRAVEAARYGMNAAEEELRAALLTMIGDVASNYVSARGYQARIALAKRTAASQRATAAITRNKFEAGGATAADAATADGQASSTEAGIPSLEAAYAETVHRLSVLTGRAPSALAERMKNPKPVPAPRLPIPTGIPADILTARPDIRLAEAQYARATARIGQAEAARYPSASLTGNIATNGVRLGDLGRSSSIGWSFGPTLTVPIFNGGQLKAAVDVTEAQRDQSFIDYRAAVLAALEDVENAIVALAQERIRSAKLASAAKSYTEANTVAQALFQSGSSSFLDVLTAERSLYSAADAQIESRVAIATDYIALNKALGGGWNGVIDSSQPIIVDKRTGPHIARQ